MVLKEDYLKKCPNVSALRGLATLVARKWVHLKNIHKLESMKRNICIFNRT